jgi:excisionase family DNA binding protein
MIADSGKSTAYDTTGQACRKLNCRKAALYRWARAGAIDFFRTPGGDFRWAADEFITRQRAAAAGDQPQATV